MDLKSLIRDVPDFPQPGILFRDITPLLHEPQAFRYVIGRFAEHYRAAAIDAIVAIESRGFIFGAPLGAHVHSIAFLLELGFLKGREALRDYEVLSLVTYD